MIPPLHLNLNASPTPSGVAQTPQQLAAAAQGQRTGWELAARALPWAALAVGVVAGARFVGRAFERPQPTKRDTVAT